MSRPERPAPHRFTHRMKMFENTLLVGSKVRLRNLQSRADLNGYIGTVIEILDTPECCEECMEPVGYAVELTPTAKGMEIIKVKRVFLEVVEKPSVLFIEGYHGENFLSTGWMGDELLSHQAWRRYFNVTRSSCVTTTSYGTVTIDLDSISTKQIYSGLYHAIVVVDFSGHHELFRRTYGECLRDLVNYGGKIAFLTSETQGKPSQIAETLKMTFNTKWERSGTYKNWWLNLYGHEGDFFAEACALKNMEPEERCFGRIKPKGDTDSDDDACVAVFKYGAGQVGYFGDVNCEPETSELVAAFAGSTLKMPGHAIGNVRSSDGKYVPFGAGSVPKSTRVKSQKDKLRNKDHIVKNKPLVWIDLEMTGLEPEVHTIIKITVMVTDATLKYVKKGPSIVIHQEQEALDNMTDWAKEKHDGSGLADASLKSQVPMKEAEFMVINFIKTHVEKDEAQLAGNSVHTDIAFLRKYMPSLWHHLDYKVVDVTGVRELCWRWFPYAYKKRPKKVLRHTALSDIEESMDELRYYMTTIFRKSPAIPNRGYR